MLKYQNQKSRGFTLIELLVVISIISLLSSVILASLQSTRTKAYDARTISDMLEIEKALELYFSDHNQYPPVRGSSSGGNVEMTAAECALQPLPEPGWCTLRQALAPYIKIPFPPTNSGEDVLVTQNGIPFWHEVRYFYRSPAVGGFQKFGIMATLFAPENLGKMINDGGAYNQPVAGVVQAFYEVGSLPRYCGQNYSGLDRDWFGFSQNTFCLGGN